MRIPVTHQAVLLLFDIDGTLTTGGPGRTAFAHAMQATFGATGPIARHDFAGKTDPRILRELLTAAGRDPQEINARQPAFWERYLAGLEAKLPHDPVTVLPGVRDLIHALAARRDVYLGLVTGNVKGGARLKLRSAGLWRHFAVGGFGSDHEMRDELPRIACERAVEHWGRPFRTQDAVVIGDTPRDVACGKANGAATVAVATGGFSEAELRETGADHVVPGFGDTRAVINLLSSCYL